jgi:CHAD domain-containing protein
MEVTGTTPLWVAARVILYGKGEDFFRLKEKVLETFDPEDIHDLRVASRRLREGLDLFAPCYPSESVTRFLRKVKRVTRYLGEMRNTDEALLFFSSLADELDDYRGEVQGLALAYAKQREKGLKGFKAGLKARVPPSLRDACLRVINSPQLFAPPVDGVDLLAPVSSFAKDAMTSRLAEVLKLVPEARRAGAVEAQHLLRIAVKHFRYRLETLSFLFGADFRVMHATLKGYQDVLGKMHDIDVFAGIVRDAALPADAERLVLAKIAVKREQLFDHFSGMLETASFEEIGARARSAW